MGGGGDENRCVKDVCEGGEGSCEGGDKDGAGGVEQILVNVESLL